MGKNSSTASEGHKEDDVVFKSKDIISKTKARQKKEYFVKFKEKTVGQKFSEWLNKHKKKIVIIACVIVVAAVVIFAAIKIITTLSKSQPEEPIEWVEEIGSAEDQINQYLEEMQNSDSDTPYTDTIYHFEELYENETDQDKKFALLVAQIKYLTEHSDYQEAEKLIVFAYMPNLSYEQQFMLAEVTYEMYVEKGDKEMADFYDDVRSELSQKIESTGGA